MHQPGSTGRGSQGQGGGQEYMEQVCAFTKHGSCHAVYLLCQRLAGDSGTEHSKAWLHWCHCLYDCACRIRKGGGQTAHTQVR